ncbi:unnamed protein product [Pseudo-nitzschia multistriata]|uniref:UDENN domain-containing protein n=1 Tax=Pseudo-nitzschia multistriata TaxID=183589 RepID=A0A448Z8D4_9STRA|nr:unnamed protein product [Pseudo-nitzschia multistriata]
MSGTQTSHTDERNSASNGGDGNDATNRSANRWHREDESQTSSTSSRYARRISSSSAPTGSSTASRTHRRSNSNEEIERIREMRARRKRAQQEGGDLQNEQTEGSAALVSRHHRRASAPISRKYGDDSGLGRKGRRRHHNFMTEDGTDESSVSTQTTTASTAASSDDTSIRSEIEARLAARRSKRKSAIENGQLLTDVPEGSSSNRGHRHTRSSIDAADLRASRNVPPRSISSGALRRQMATTYEEAKGITRENRVSRTKSTDRGLLQTRISNSDAEKDSRVPTIIEPYESRGSRKFKPKLQPRSSSNDISERLRERREARERERKEREKKYDLKDLSLSTGSESTQSNRVGNAVEHTRVDTTKRPTNHSEMNIAEDLKHDESDTGNSSSVRLCIISISDLPASVVSNIPLCPVLKMGLVELPAGVYKDGGTKSVTSTTTKYLFDQGIQAMGSAKIRSTTPKILGKRDSGTIEYHEEYRWDNLKQPQTMGLCIELCVQGVRTPLNYMESPPAVFQYDAYASPSGDTLDSAETSLGSSPKLHQAPIRRAPPSRTKSFDALRIGIWNRSRTQQDTEMEAAEAAAAVARMLVDESEPESNDMEQGQSSMKISETPNSDYDVTLDCSNGHLNVGLTSDSKLGVVVIPLAQLALDKDMKKGKNMRLEQWYELDTGEESNDVSSRRKKPRVFLEITLSSPTSLDDSEDEDGVYDEDEEPLKSSLYQNASFLRRASIKARCQNGEHKGKKEERKIEDPILEPGVIDFVAVVGCKNIGNQKNDEGMKGWVKATPECVIMEQFPPNNEFYMNSGRKAALPEMLQWFCFPEGARLWRGTNPPTHSDLNLKRFSAASPQNLASSIAAFDACLGCTTSFSWFAIASNSDQYGSSLVKTYGAVIRFYVPAPTGIDPTQDDFAQAIMGRKADIPPPGAVKRLWVPIAICFTSNLPIVGIMEALLLRLCEEISTIHSGLQSGKLVQIQEAVANIVLKYQKPIAGAVNCSVPFLPGDRFLLSLPPREGLPSLPHGRALISVCRLLGADGLNYLLSAVLTECKILLHSEDIAEIAMVAEVITALTYPFAWSLPYIPILPLGMIEFVEAPLAYLLGMPTCNLKMIDPGALEDTVVVDLNKAFSSEEYYLEKSKPRTASNKHPALLPTSVATKISDAFYKLLREEDEMEERYSGTEFLEHSLPHLEEESLAEREFRVTVAIEICGLLRGYQDCMGAVFDRDKFLKSSPALYEEKSEYKFVGEGSGIRNEVLKTKVMSSRSKRFLSSLVSGQNFQQLLERLDSDDALFFHEILKVIGESASDRMPPKRTSSGDFGLSQTEKNVDSLIKSLQKVEDKIPTFLVKVGGGLDTGDDEDDIPSSLMWTENESHQFDALDHDTHIMNIEDQDTSTFSSNLLSSIKIESASKISESSMQAVSMEYLAKLETTPWEYNNFLNISTEDMNTQDKIKLRDAIGERRFRSWKLARSKTSNSDEDMGFFSQSTRESAKQESAVDLTALVTSAKNDSTDSSSLSSTSNQSRMPSQTPAQERIAAAKSRDIIRRCMDRANTDQISKSDQINPFIENGRDLMAEAEKALRNPSAQLFLISILAQRSRLENKRSRTARHHSTAQNPASRLDDVAFDCLVRLSCAMLDSCMEYKEYEMAYRLLTNSAGFIMVQELDNYGEYVADEYGNGQSLIVITMTSRIGLHPIFADIRVWETVMTLHLRDRETVKKSDEFSSYSAGSDYEEEEEVVYDSAVATLYEMVGYGIPGEELSRFAMRVSQEHGWFCDDRGRQLLMLARRISIRRDQADMSGAGNTGDIDMVRKGPDLNEAFATFPEGGDSTERPDFVWKEVGWCHPAAPSRKNLMRLDRNRKQLPIDKFMKRNPVTALASFGSTMVASGGLDGGVFLAHLLSDHSLTSTANTEDLPEVRGIHLDWGVTSRPGSSSDGEYGVGAVSCLAAIYGDTSHTHSVGFSKDVKDPTNGVDILDSMEGSKIVAGTTAGDLRVWSVKDVYSSIVTTKNDSELTSGHGASRLKYSLRGRALAGHRGGVTCIDVPSQVYRPDSFVTGGADGSIKLWNLRAPTGNRRNNNSGSNGYDSNDGSGQHQRGRMGDALNTLSGHDGRVLSITTAWHGDHLLSGGADRSIRVWDLGSSGGKCLHKLFGHFGWVTNVQYWGPNTIVSASTDRSVALWDARVRSSPLFILRNHSSPISDLLVGSRTDPYMVSAAADGTIATWDFRSLSETTNTEERGKCNKGCKIIRMPSASMHQTTTRKKVAVGSIHLARDVTDPMNSFMSVGSDAILRKWNIASGNMLEESPTGHCDRITCFSSFSQNHGFGTKPANIINSTVEDGIDAQDKGFLTTSLDGTIRMRKLIGKSDC